VLIAAACGHNRKSFPSDNAYTLIETSKLNDADPQAWLTDVRDRIAEYKINRIDDLVPWRYAEPSA
jgi:transposase